MSTDTATTEQPGLIESGRHPVNIGHLVMGLAFLGMVGVWALIQGNVVQGHDIRWLLPMPWVLAGIAGLLATTLTSGRHASRQTGWVGLPEPADTHAPPTDSDDNTDTTQEIR
ncbi:MAG: hypothetical protein JWO11_1225 [Nocardioides sp.]|jgi:hypothetical protein|nr:hypothetical protein [Nocardioides sp.]